MKRIFSLLACLAVLLSLSVPVFATEVTDTEPSTGEAPAETTTEPVTVEATTDDKQIVVNVAVTNETPAETPTEIETEEVPEEDAEEAVTYAAYSVTTLDETSAETIPDSIPAAITALFGEYTPRTQTVTEYLEDGSEITYQEYVPGLAGLDWTWLSSVTIFTVFLYCVLRAIGGCLKWI